MTTHRPVPRLGADARWAVSGAMTAQLSGAAECVCGHGRISHGTADTHCTMCNVRGAFGCAAFRPSSPTAAPAVATTPQIERLHFPDGYVPASGGKVRAVCHCGWATTPRVSRARAHDALLREHGYTGRGRDAECAVCGRRVDRLHSIDMPWELLRPLLDEARGREVYVCRDRDACHTRYRARVAADRMGCGCSAVVIAAAGHQAGCARTASATAGASSAGKAIKAMSSSRPADPWEAARRRAEDAARVNLAAVDAELAALGPDAEPAERQRLLGRRGTAQHELHTTLYLEDWFRELRRHPRRYAQALAQVQAR